MIDLNDWTTCDRHETAHPRGEPCPKCQAVDAGNCHGFVSDRSAVLCGLLAEARDIIAEHVSIDAGIEWMERLHRSPQFKDPDPP